MKSRNNNINNDYDSDPTAFFDAVGGNNQKCKNLSKRISQYHIENQIPSVGDIMEGLRSKLATIKRSDVPLFLDPKTATFLDVGIHGKVRQFLSESTIEKHLRYARFMETHSCPIDFRNLNVEDFIKHIDYRIEFENATPNALKHEKKAIMMFLKAFKQYTEDWKKYVKTPPIVESEDNIFVPFPETVNKLYHAKYSDNNYENTLLQTIIFLDFNFGMRPPSEICNLDLDDVKINNDGTGYIRIWEDKKRRKPRLIYPYNKSVLSSTVFRTLKNYIDNWRPLVVNDKSGKALFLNFLGERITGSYLRKRIVPVAEIICNDKSFKLYTMRHTFATYFYEYTKDIKRTAKKLGHKKSSSIDKYIHIAESIKEQVGKRNLFNQALRLIKDSSRGKPVKKDCLKNRHQSLPFSPVGNSGPGRI